ncbi:MAG: hypothetical protein ACE361_14410 [Aureliella sp.]
MLERDYQMFRIILWTTGVTADTRQKPTGWLYLICSSTFDVAEKANGSLTQI